MTINKTITGFCPTLNRDNSIELTYKIIEKAGKMPDFLQVGADCEYGSYGKCPIRLKCPIRAKAPKVISSD